MHRIFVAAILATLIFQTPSYATSRVREPAKKSKRSVSSAACEARARFIQPFYLNEHVYWKFEIQSTQSKTGAECPPVDEPLEILVWGAQHIPQQGGMFVYPEYIEEPTQNSWKQLRIRRDPRGWMMTNWEDGILPSP